MQLGVALYGQSYHQVFDELENHPSAQLVAYSCIDPKRLPESLRERTDIRQCFSLDELLNDPKVQLIVFCSARRSEQAAQAIRAMEAGKHVYVEKPCALTEADLDSLIATSERTGHIFREMAGTAFEQPYSTMRDIVASGTIGQVVQVLAQKSYPYHADRPQDEQVDGGLTLQNGVHALRFIEHVAGVPVVDIQIMETSTGNPVSGGGLRIATSYIMRLENNGVATAVVNYLNPRGFGSWGNEMLRIFGTNGMIEATDGGQRTRLIVGDNDYGPLKITTSLPTYFDMVVNYILHGHPMPLTLEQELHPTRVLIRAKAALGNRADAPV